MADHNSTCRDFYVYLHRRATDQSVFYVGKGTGPRAKSRAGRSQYWKRIVSKHGLSIEIIEAGMQEWWAFEREEELISFYGKKSLCNLTDGGEGPSGLRHRDESKARMSAAKTGRKLGPMPEEQKRKIGAAQAGRKGREKTIEERQRISAALRKRERTQETSRRISIALTGKTATEVHRTNLSRSHGGKEVVCLDTEEVFYGASPAAKWLQGLGFQKASPGAVSNNCSGRSSHAYGYRFAYVTA